MEQVEKDLSFLPGHQLMRAVTVLLIAGVIVVVIVSLGLPVYRTVKLNRLVSDAQGFAERGDNSRAVLAAQTALLLDEDNIPALEILADAAEQSKSPFALQIRRRISQLKPQGSAQLLALAKAEVSANESAAALRTLAAIQEDSRDNKEYWKLLSAAHLAQGQMEPAIAAAEEAYQLAGSGSPEALQLAVALLHQSSAESAGRLNELIRDIWDNDELRLQMSRMLVEVARRNGDSAVALQVARQASKEKLAQAEDLVVYYQLLSRVSPEQALAEVTEHLAAAKKAPQKMIPLLQWLLIKRETAMVLNWLESLPQETLETDTFAVIKADALAVAGRWSELTNYLAEESWTGPEFIRLAYLARALHENDSVMTSNARWSQALREAAVSQQFLWSLWKVSSRWPGWERKKLDVLWELYENSRSVRVLLLLADNYRQEGDSANLFRVAEKLYHIDRENVVAANNYAYLSLLLDRDSESAAELAGELYAAAPLEVARLSTYLFALIQTGRYEEAANLLDEAPAELAKAPEAALIKALLFHSVGDDETARLLLQQVDQESLLDRERVLFDKVANAPR